VNAHSHLEYRGLQGKLSEAEYWPWIRAITKAKLEQSPADVELDCRQAAAENVSAGVRLIAEHSDRPFAGAALDEAGLQGVIFQEVITRFESDGPDARLELARARLRGQATDGNRIASYYAPHAYQTVDAATLRGFGCSDEPFSMHVAETDLENQLTLQGTGTIADFFRELSIPYAPTGKRLVPTLDGLGLVRRNAQFVHCCALEDAEITLLAERGVAVAHCPRSNRNLNCPIAPVREMLDAGIKVGLGLDSAASSGPIDMFEEMRCALDVSRQRGKPVTAEEVWLMATEIGADSLRFAVPAIADWRIETGSDVELIRIHVAGVKSMEGLIRQGSPQRVEWSHPQQLPSV